jgi:hypothetical protein
MLAKWPTYRNADKTKYNPFLWFAVDVSYDLSSSNFLLSSTRHSGTSVRPWDREID